MLNTSMADSASRSISSERLAALLPDLSARKPAYRYLAQSIRTLILEGRLLLHVRLPAERELAAVLVVSRPTIKAAYDLLRESGYARSRRGAGTWTMLPDGKQPAVTQQPLAPADESIDLAAATLGLPESMLTEALAYSGPLLTQRAHTPGYHPFGLTGLRSAVAERYTRRGLPTLKEQILVTSGAQQGLTLALGLLTSPGDRVMVENPTYPNALDAIRHARLRPTPVPVTESGWDEEIMQATLRQTLPRLAYLIPDFHNPVGCLMPDEQRSAILQATSRTGTWLVIDETLTDIALDVPAPAPFVAQAATGDKDHVITVGSMSKSHWGGLRIGWVRATPRLITKLAELRVSMDIAGSVMDQLLATSLILRTDAVLKLRLEQVRTQRTSLLHAVACHLPQWRTHIPPGGLSLWVDLGKPIASALADRVRAKGVRIEGGARFSADPGTHDHRLRIPYTLPAETLDEAVRRLASVLADESPLGSTVDSPQWFA
ncbi:transcriptional regulator, GntR family [Streptomyces sp. 2323.1]|uniref:MocR-like transcription factor YczR n=1 Tax=Streptomyces sp. 2323.1 TaxID=1938841 RepID=UPI000BBF60A7|nr:transcriptional regulator, GntR family [Streptomyces sp. 2323.1]